MTATGVSTSSGTHTVSISASDVRQVMRHIGADIRAVCQAAPVGACPFDMEQALIEVSVMLVNGVINGASLLIDEGGTVTREYEFRFVSAQMGTTGPPAGQPPIGHVPAGARIRLRVTPDPDVPEAEREAVIRKLGWVTGAPLVYAAGMTKATYGSFQSGGLSVERTIKAAP